MTLHLALLHGFTGTPESWNPVRELLPTHLVVRAPALTGHAPDAEVQPAGFEAEVGRIAELLRRTAPLWHIGGYSLGGRVALGLLASHPELFASAVLVGTHAGLETDDDRRERRQDDDRWRALLDERGIEAFVDAWERTPLFSTQDALPPGVGAGQRAARLRHDPKALSRSLAVIGLGVMPPYWEALPEIRVPVTLVVGGRDPKFGSVAERMHAGFPDAEIDVVPGAGHNVVLERPEAVADALARTLGRAS